MSLEVMVKELDAALTAEYEKYVKFHEELNKHRGRPIEDTNLPEVNRLIGEIQNTFACLYPVYHFIGTRYEPSTNVVNGYNEFIDVLKKAGARASSEDLNKN